MYIEKDERELNKGFLFEIQRFVAKKEDNVLESFHWHSFFEITYVESGTGFYYVNGKEYYMKAGDIIIFNHVDLHGWKVIDEDMSLLVMVFSTDFIADRTSPFDYDYLIPFMERGSNFRNKIGKEEKNTQLMVTIMREIYKESEEKESGYQLMIKANVLRLLTVLTRHYQNPEINKQLIAKKKDEMKRLQESFHYIKDHFTEKITLEDAANASFMSPTYFSYFFKKVTNEKFQDYLAKMRIKKAEELLKNTNLGVVDIASQCGFNNMSNFYRLFQKYNGTRPRKKAAEEKA